MKAAFTVARKEIRGLFGSPIALLFLGVFQLVTLFTFFSGSRFFARNIADVRPLFEWLPLLLVVLVSAVTMRAWAEERKMGTLEVLLTLPVSTRDLVLGKFFAALALVGVALALTLPLPIMASTLGDLDWGPVVGGYVGALLLGGLYVSIGLCVSSRTDNQVVSLMVTLLVGGLMYLVGTDAVTSLAGTDASELLRSIGTGSRFESIERGVLDWRDIIYYVVLTGTFLVLNWVFLEIGRIDPGSVRGRARATSMWSLAGLVAANAVLAVAWTQPITAIRIDLTENGDYSISPTTSGVLAQLGEPLFIDGYFSERTHPLLAPLVPQITDMLEEYEIAGNGRVVVTIADPNEDEDLEQEIAEQYSIRSVPFQVDSRHSQAVVNSFFHVLVRYGDQYETLSFNELIEFYADSNGPEVRLRNLEYDLTRTIKRVSQDFQTLASVVQHLPEAATITAYITPATLPEDFQEIETVVRKVGEEVAEQGGDKLSFAVIDPGDNEALKQELFDKYGLRPLAVDLFARQTFYLDVVITMGDEIQRLSPRGDVGEADLRTAFESAIKRVTPGQLTTLGVLSEIPVAPPPNPQIPPQFQPPPPQPDYQILQQVMGDTYEVAQVDGNDGTVPGTIDVLLVAKPGALTSKQLYAIDQYLMRGGRVIALAASHKVKFDRGAISATNSDKGFLDLLATYGVSVGDAFVLDERNAPFPRPVQETRGGMTFQRIELQPYPFFIDVRQDTMERGHAALSGLNNLTVPFASALSVTAIEGVESQVLFTSTDEAWEYTGRELDPPTPSSERTQATLGVVLSGTFPSHFADKPDPTFEGGDDVDSGRTIKTSLPDARLAVIGSAELSSDLVLQLASSPGGEVHRGNLQLLQNLIDWSTEDTELLEIRTAGNFARTLLPMTDAEHTTYEMVQYALAILLLGLVAVLPMNRRRSTRKISLNVTEAK